MSLSPDEVRHVARLARLKLTPEEEAHFARQLGDVLDYARQLDELDTSSIAPTAHAVTLATPMADDEVRPSLDPDEALANAPDARGTSVAVPRILE